VTPDFEENMRDAYEADELDIDFLQKNLIPHFSSLFQNSFNKILKEFEKIIIRFETLEMNCYFKKLNIRNLSNGKNFSITKNINRDRKSLYYLRDPDHNLFTFLHQEIIFDYWRKKQNFFQRPLLRKYWSALHLPFHNFGSQNMNKMAFAPRDLHKKKTRLKDRFFRGEMMMEELKQMQRELAILMALIRMVTFREKLKYEQIILDLIIFTGNGKPQFDVFSCEKILDTAKGYMEFVEISLKNGEPNWAFMKENINHFQDRLLFVCNIVENLGKLDLDLTDFVTPKICDDFQVIKMMQKKLENCEEESPNLMKSNCLFFCFYFFFKNHSSIEIFYSFSLIIIQEYLLSFIIFL